MEWIQELVKTEGCISSPFNSYEVQKILGSGSFGTVALCRKNGSDQKVALKVVNNTSGKPEAKCMDFIAKRGSASHHIVEWLGSFNFNGNFCLEFEALDISLGDFLKKSSSLPLHHIRPIITQMAEALMFLKSINVIHGDLKPDNVMMVDHVGKPLQVKIIDFGLARYAHHAKQGIYFGTLCYSAPEMAIGAPMNHGLDMWSLGCIAAEMYLGRMLFSATKGRELIEMIVHMLGLPPRHVLDSGITTYKYFGHPDGEKWIHMTKYGFVTEEMDRPEDLIEIMNDKHKMNPHDCVDVALFIKLVQQLLNLDPDSRIDPLAVLEHPFINRTDVEDPRPHLESQSSSSPSLSETPPVGQTCGLKRMREEEEECPEKRRFKGEVIVISSSESPSGPRCCSPPDSLSTKHHPLPGPVPTQPPKLVACSSAPDPKPHLESQSSSPPPLSETPPVGQTCGLKRMREEEEECPEKRRFKGEVIVISCESECIPSPTSLPETPAVARTCGKKRTRKKRIPEKRFKVVSVISSTDFNSAALSSGRGVH